MSDNETSAVTVVPVAWRWFNQRTGQHALTSEKGFADHMAKSGYDVEPLYARPTPPVAASVREALIELPEYLDYLEQSLVDLDIDMKLPDNMQSPCVWADRVRAALSEPAPAAPTPTNYAAFASSNWPDYLRKMIDRTKLDAFDKGTLHQIADALEHLAARSQAETAATSSEGK